MFLERVIDKRMKLVILHMVVWTGMLALAENQTPHFLG